MILAGKGNAHKPWRVLICTGQSLMDGSLGFFPSFSGVTEPRTFDDHEVYYWDGSDPVLWNRPDNRNNQNSTVGTSAPPWYIGRQMWLDDPYHRRLVLWSSEGGATYAQLKKGTDPYNGWYNKLTAFVTWAESRGEHVVVDWAVIWHGTANVSTAGYQALLEEWRDDIVADCQAATGQQSGPDVLIDQVAYGATGWTDGSGLGAVANAQRLAAEQNSDIHMMQPRAERYASWPDGVHLHVDESVYRSGRAAQAIAAVNAGTHQWLYPTSVAAGAGNTIVVDFNVPDGPIVLDENYRSPYSIGVEAAPVTNYGFSYSDDGAADIASVAVTGASQITVTLDGAASTNPVLRYGEPVHTPVLGGKIWGGAVRDSGSFFYRVGPRPNYCVFFESAVS